MNSKKIITLATVALVSGLFISAQSAAKNEKEIVPVKKEVVATAEKKDVVENTADLKKEVVEEAKDEVAMMKCTKEEKAAPAEDSCKQDDSCGCKASKPRKSAAQEAIEG